MSEEAVYESPTVDQNDGITGTENGKRSTPSITAKKNFVGGRRPGPRSKTRKPRVVVEKLDSLEEWQNANDNFEDRIHAEESDLEDSEEDIKNQNSSYDEEFDDDDSVIADTSDLGPYRLQNRVPSDMCEIEKRSVNSYHTEEKCMDDTSSDDVEDTINLALGDDEIKFFTDEEDADIHKEDELNEGQATDDEFQSVTSNSDSDKETNSSNDSGRAPTTYRSPVEEFFDTESRSPEGDNDSNNDKPNVDGVVEVESKDKTKQVRGKVDDDNKQSICTKVRSPSNDLSKFNESVAPNVWVSNLSFHTKAIDLRRLFSTYGKVIAVKIKINRTTPGGRCYGFVTLSSAKEANLAVKSLNQTELDGRILAIRRAKGENGYQQCTVNAGHSKENDCAVESERKYRNPKDRCEDKRKTITIDNDNKKTEVLNYRKRSLSNDTKPQSKRSKVINDKYDFLRQDRNVKGSSSFLERTRTQKEKERLKRKKKRRDLLRLTRFRNERERQKQKEYALREERRIRIENERQMDTDRKQKEEFVRLAKERQQLKIERELIEKEKAKLMDLERENQRLQRERLQRDKEERSLRAQEKLKAAKLEDLSTTIKRAVHSTYVAPFGKKHLGSSSPSRYDNSRPKDNIIDLTASPPPSNIPTLIRYFEPYPTASHQSSPLPCPPPPPVLRPNVSVVGASYGVPSSSDHGYRSRDGQSDRTDDSRRKETGSQQVHTSSQHESSKSSYVMPRSTGNDLRSLLPPVTISTTFGCSSVGPRSSTATEHSRTDPWSTSSRTVSQNVVWPQTPRQPLASSSRWSSATSPRCERISGNTVVYDHQTVKAVDQTNRYGGPANVGMNAMAVDKINRYGSSTDVGMAVANNNRYGGPANVGMNTMAMDKNYRYGGPANVGINTMAIDNNYRYGGPANIGMNPMAMDKYYRYGGPANVGMNPMAMDKNYRYGGPANVGMNRMAMDKNNWYGGYMMNRF